MLEVMYFPTSSIYRTPTSPSALPPLSAARRFKDAADAALATDRF
jgi:hypothetical protein